MDLQSLILTYQRTNDNKLLENIIQALQPFIQKHTVRLLKILPLEFEDIKQELMIVILKRIRTYDAHRGKFLTYLMNTFQGDPTRILSSLKRKKRGGDGNSHYLTVESLQQVINHEEGTTLEDVLVDESDIQKDINYGLLGALRDTLVDHERQVFDLLYGDSELSDGKIALLLNFKVSKVIKLRKVIRTKCREAMGISGCNS